MTISTTITRPSHYVSHVVCCCFFFRKTGEQEKFSNFKIIVSIRSGVRSISKNKCAALSRRIQTHIHKQQQQPQQQLLKIHCISKCGVTINADTPENQISFDYDIK